MKYLLLTLNFIMLFSLYGQNIPNENVINDLINGHYAKISNSNKIDSIKIKRITVLNEDKLYTTYLNYCDWPDNNQCNIEGYYASIHKKFPKSIDVFISIFINEISSFSYEAHFLIDTQKEYKIITHYVSPEQYRNSKNFEIVNEFENKVLDWYLFFPDKKPTYMYDPFNILAKFYTFRLKNEFDSNSLKVISGSFDITCIPYIYPPIKQYEVLGYEKKEDSLNRTYYEFKVFVLNEYKNINNEWEEFSEVETISVSSLNGFWYISSALIPSTFP